jgi:hypothetical protein
MVDSRGRGFYGKPRLLEGCDDDDDDVITMTFELSFM